MAWTGHRALIGVMCGALLSAAGCALRSPSIADLKYNPGRYYRHTVSVEGVVSSAWNVPLVPFKMYRIQDSTGELTVISDSDRVPPRGARVVVRGRVEEVAMVGGRSVGLHIREDHLRVLRY